MPQQTEQSKAELLPCILCSKDHTMTFSNVYSNGRFVWLGECVNKPGMFFMWEGKELPPKLYGVGGNA